MSFRYAKFNYFSITLNVVYNNNNIIIIIIIIIIIQRGFYKNIQLRLTINIKLKIK